MSHAPKSPFRALALLLIPILLTPFAPPASAAAVAPLAVPAKAPDAAPLVAAADTELVFEMLDTVSSATHVRGDSFRLRLALPLVVDGQVLVPAGTLARGEVVHAAKTRWGGEAGELILAARTLDFDGRQIPLRAFQTRLGVSHERLARNLMIVSPIAALLVRGKHVEIAAGGLISAKLKEATTLPALGPAPDAAVAAEDATPSAEPAAPAATDPPAAPAAETAVNPSTSSGEVSE